MEDRAAGEGEEVVDAAAERTRELEGEGRGGDLAAGLDGAQGLPRDPDALGERGLGEPQGGAAPAEGREQRRSGHGRLL